MNIMLVSVSERTREIGVRMAVGARTGDILQQFLIEAVLVCLLGGVGVLLSLLIGVLFEHFSSQFTLSYSLDAVLMAFFCSSLIGVLFGFFPARRAARMDPIHALERSRLSSAPAPPHSPALPRAHPASVAWRVGRTAPCASPAA